MPVIFPVMPKFRTANADANANPFYGAKMGEIARLTLPALTPFLSFRRFPALPSNSEFFVM
jgi:hypothetical protein